MGFNCAAVVETLLEAELFGIEDRTATGVRRRRGQFESADGGTLFLDEVSDDLALSAQAKLLRAIQNLTVERVGSLGTSTAGNDTVIGQGSAKLCWANHAANRNKKRTVGASLLHLRSEGNHAPPANVLYEGTVRAMMRPATEMCRSPQLSLEGGVAAVAARRKTADWVPEGYRVVWTGSDSIVECILDCGWRLRFETVLHLPQDARDQLFRGHDAWHAEGWRP